MTEAGSPAREDLTEADIAAIGEVVSTITSPAEVLIHLAVGRVPRPGSRAQAFMADSANSPTLAGGSYVASAHLAIGMGVFAALDHIRSFAVLVGEGQAMSLATLTRGAVEALGKAHHLLKAATASEMVGQHLKLGLSELGASAVQSEFHSLGGQEIDVRAHMEALKEKLATMDMKPARIGPTTVASSLLSDCAPGIPGRAFYSQLSAVAHGETAGVSMFVRVDSESRVGFFKRRDAIIPYVGALVRSLVTVMAELVGHFALEQEHQAWVDALERVGPLMRRLGGISSEGRL